MTLPHTGKMTGLTSRAERADKIFVVGGKWLLLW